MWQCPLKLCFRDCLDELCKAALDLGRSREANERRRHSAEARAEAAEAKYEAVKIELSQEKNKADIADKDAGIREAGLKR